MKANKSKSIHVTFTRRRETCRQVHINNLQLPQEEDIKYLRVHFDRRLHAEPGRHFMYELFKVLKVMTVIENVCV
jgi:hypothetical protein